MVGGIADVVYAYPYTPEGLTAAKDNAKQILIESYNGEEDYLNVFEQKSGKTLDSVLSGKMMKRWLIESGQTEKAKSWFC